MKCLPQLRKGLIGDSASLRITIYWCNFDGSRFLHSSFTLTAMIDQMAAYGDNARGFALGLAPKMFEVVDHAGLQADEMSFIGPVLYDGRRSSLGQGRDRRRSVDLPRSLRHAC